jgi:haloalkane dehalogenase
MDFIQPDSLELSRLRADPLLWEQELDVRPEFAEAVERACGKRAGRVYWRSSHDHLYAMELADLGRGRPSMAMVLGFWDRYEPRPPEHEIDADLLVLCDWLAGVGGLNPADIAKVAQHAGIKASWPEGSVMRTPDERFANLPGFPYEPRYVDVEGLRMAYIESGSGDPILMMHGEPTWGYLYRHMIPPLAKIGRCVVPDLIGFGRSDKPVAKNAYSYKAHARWIRAFITALDLRKITLICQDWGGLLGLRVASQMPDRFARIVAMNTGLPFGAPGGDAFMRWRRFCLKLDELHMPMLMKNSLRRRTLTPEEGAAYQAPFPSKEYQTAALVFPRLVPIRKDDPGVYENRIAIEQLKAMDVPVLLPWASDDAITVPAEKFLRSIFKNVAPPLWIERAGHFIQEDAGEEVAAHIAKWMEETSV